MPLPGYAAWISKLGLSGKGVTIAICDTGIDCNSDNNTNGHPDLRGRQVAFVDYTDGRKKTDEVGHGTHVAGICVGDPLTGLIEGKDQMCTIKDIRC